ncbi:MarR family transcriptional regulator [Actinomyces viscosus]|nr:MarR family transcriptional regulator [Actinomyces viscosus]TFH54041.1 MarR family transcriptional regulator [Actinomyces viscosus]
MRTRFQRPEASPGFLMWRTALAWQRDIMAALEPVGLTHSQFVILACTSWLEEHGDSSTQVMIASQAGMDVKTASQVLRKLEQAGLISRQQDPSDARARIVTTTAAGRDVGARATRLVEDADEAYFAAMPHLRDALLQEAGPAVRRPAERHVEGIDGSARKGRSRQNPGDADGPIAAAAP